MCKLQGRGHNKNKSSYIYILLGTLFEIQADIFMSQIQKDE